MDATDQKILELLTQNSRAQWKEIGDLVHLTGPAVAGRVQKMEDEGIIQGFTVRVNPEKVGRPITAYVTVYMQTKHHKGFQELIQTNPYVVEAHRISGRGCYLLKVQVKDHDALKELLDSVLRYGNYGLCMSIEAIK